MHYSWIWISLAELRIFVLFHLNMSNTITQSWRVYGKNGAFSDVGPEISLPIVWRSVGGDRRKLMETNNAPAAD